MYLIIEMQKFSDSSVSVVQPVITRQDPFEAESEFHRICSVAAVSSVPQHTVCYLDDAGNQVKPPECYEHPARS